MKLVRAVRQEWKAVYLQAKLRFQVEICTEPVFKSPPWFFATAYSGTGREKELVGHGKSYVLVGISTS